MRIEEQIAKVEVLLDMLDGADAGPRHREPGESGPGPAGYEPCLGCAINVRVWGCCPACDDTGFVRSRSDEQYDPYLSPREGPVTINVKRSERPTQEVPVVTPKEISFDHPSPAEIVARSRAFDLDELPDDEYVELNSVERVAHIHLMVRRFLDQLRQLILRAKNPQGLLRRDPEDLRWAARRLPPLPHFLLEIT